MLSFHYFAIRYFTIPFLWPYPGSGPPISPCPCDSRDGHTFSWTAAQGPARGSSRECVLRVTWSSADTVLGMTARGIFPGKLWREHLEACKAGAVPFLPADFLPAASPEPSGSRSNVLGSLSAKMSFSGPQLGVVQPSYKGKPDFNSKKG